MNLNLMAPINQLGYGIVGLNLLKGLAGEGCTVSLFPIGGIEAPPETHSLISAAISNAQQFDPLAPTLRLYHQFDMAPSIGRGKRVGFPIFELDRLTPAEIHSIKSLDRVVTCSKWAAEIVRRDTNVETSVVPLGVDREVFSAAVPPPTSPYRFITAGKLEYRKGHDVVIEAFDKAFGPDDDVQLLMCCDNPFLTPQQTKSWHTYASSKKTGGKIKFAPRQASQNDLAKLMQSAHCGVFPARAEGWNLELLEMMACNRPVITTNYSAHTEFANSSNSYLVEVSELEIAMDGTQFFKGQGKWAKLDATHINRVAAYMKELYIGRNILSQNAAGVETAKKFSWSNTARNLINVLSTL